MRPSLEAHYLAAQDGQQRQVFGLTGDYLLIVPSQGCVASVAYGRCSFLFTAAGQFGFSPDSLTNASMIVALFLGFMPL
jgi:hypothetical protein